MQHEGCVERLIQHEAKPSAVFSSRHSPSAAFFIHTSIRSALSVILYFMFVLLSATLPKSLQSLLIKISVIVYKINF